VPPERPLGANGPTPRPRWRRPQVFWAFFLDCALFSVWQALMLEGAKPLYRFVPVLGLGAWLLQGGGGGSGGGGGGAGQQQPDAGAGR
jgi:hypothetical protein